MMMMNWRRRREGQLSVVSDQLSVVRRAASSCWLLAWLPVEAREWCGRWWRGASGIWVIRGSVGRCRPTWRGQS